MIRTESQNLKYPLLLVHGLFSSSWTWRRVKASFISDYDLRYGGEVSLKPNSPHAPLLVGDFYTMNFSSNHSLSYRQQAEELSYAIDRILRVNSSQKIVIAAHSMGGLASRMLIQILGERRVHSLITLATPHYGSPIALLRNSAQRRIDSGFHRLERILGRPDGSSEEHRGWLSRLLRWLLRIGSEAQSEISAFFSNDAFIELAPQSPALEELNRAALPTNINYVFIVATVPEFFKHYVRAFTERFLDESLSTFAKYVSRYMRTEIKDLTEFRESDGAVPALSQAIVHFDRRPKVFATLPVIASHNRVTKRPARLFHALAICGVVGSEKPD